MSVYGTPVGTVVVNTLDATGSYIINQYASAQTPANFWISGKGRIDTGLGINIDPVYALDVNSGAAIAGRFDGRVIGVDAVNANEFITKAQLDASVGLLFARTDASNATAGAMYFDSSAQAMLWDNVTAFSVWSTSFSAVDYTASQPRIRFNATETELYSPNGFNFIRVNDTTNKWEVVDTGSIQLFQDNLAGGVSALDLVGGNYSLTGMTVALTSSIIHNDSTSTLTISSNKKLILDTATSGGLATQMKGRFSLAEGVNVAASTSLALGYGGNAFTITGNTTVNAISTTDWQEGSVIQLHITGTPIFKHNTAGGVSTLPMRLSGAADFPVTLYTVLELQLKDGYWNEIGRAIIGGTGPGIMTADNGLHLSDPTNVRLGGTLIENTLVDWTGFDMIWGNNSENSFYYLDAARMLGTYFDDTTAYFSESQFTKKGFDLNTGDYGSLYGGYLLKTDIGGTSGDASYSFWEHYSTNGTVNVTYNAGNNGETVDTAFIDFLVEDATSTSYARSHWGGITATFPALGIYLQTRPTGVATYKGIYIRQDSDLEFQNYPTSRNDGSTSKALYIDDANGRVRYGTVSAGIAGITADNGLTASTSTNVQLGQNVGAVGDPGKLLNNREIPMDGKSFVMHDSNARQFMVSPSATFGEWGLGDIDQVGDCAYLSIASSFPSAFGFSRLVGPASVAIGDLDGYNGGTSFATIGNNGGQPRIVGGWEGNEYFHLSFSQKVYMMGDLNGDLNGWQLQIRDNDQRAYLGTAFGTGTQISLDGSSGRGLFSFSDVTGSSLSFDQFNALYKIGSLGWGNSTFLEINDTAQTWKATNIPLATTANVIYYDPTTDLITYGAAPAGGTITANNGLNMSTATNVQWGGNLVIPVTNIGFGEAEEVNFIRDADNFMNWYGDTSTWFWYAKFLESYGSMDISAEAYSISMSGYNGGVVQGTWRIEYDGTITHDAPLTIINTGVTNTSGLRLAQLTSASPTSAGGAIGVDASGNVVRVAVGISGITADNGLTANTSTNVRLGGTLLQNTTVATTSAFQMIFSGSNASVATVSITNSAASTGLFVGATAGGATGAEIQGGSNGIRVYGMGATSTAVFGQSPWLPMWFNNNATTNGVKDIALLQRQPTTGANGDGLDIVFGGFSTTNVSLEMGRIRNDFTTLGTTTSVAEFVFLLPNGSSLANNHIATLSGNGAVRFAQYGAAAFTGTPVYNLAVDASGNVIETGLGESIISGGYKFDDSTTAADPGSGDLRLDNATYASVTNIYISQTSNYGTDTGNILGALITGDKIYIQQKNDATKWLRVQISSTPTDNGTWWTIPVTYINSGGTLFDNNELLTVAAVMTGAGGGGSGTVNTGAALKAAYYPSAGTTVDDWVGVEFNNTNLNTKIMSQATTQVLLEIRQAASQSADPFIIKNSIGGTVVQFKSNGFALFTTDGTATIQNPDSFDHVLQTYGGNNARLLVSASSGYAYRVVLAAGGVSGTYGGTNGGYAGTESNHALNFITNKLTRATIDNSGNTVFFGTVSVPHTGGSSERFGALTVASNTQSTAVGYSASSSGLEGTAIGAYSTASGANSVALGASATASANNTLAIGRACNATALGAIALGLNTLASGSEATAIGGQAEASGQYSTSIGGLAIAKPYGAIAIGRGTVVDTGHTYSIALGSGTATTAANQFVIGNWLYGTIQQVYMGSGVTSALPSPITFNASGSEGANAAGVDFNIAAGKATGNAAGGKITFKTSDPTGSGTTLQTLTNKFEISVAGQLRANLYGVGTFTGTPAYTLGVTATGLLIEMTGGSVAWNDITSPAGAQALTFQAGENSVWTDQNTTADLFTVNNATQTTGSMFSLNRTSTAVTTGNNIMEIISSGANAGGSVEAYGLVVSVTNTGTGSINRAAKFTASGAATNNVAIEAVGRVGIGSPAPQTHLQVGHDAGQSSAFGSGSQALFTNSGSSAYITVLGPSLCEIFVGAESGQGIVGTISNHALRFRANNTTFLSVLTGGALEINEVTAPSTPASGFGRLYAKTDGKIYFLNDAATEFDLTLGGSGTSIWDIEDKTAEVQTTDATVTTLDTITIPDNSAGILTVQLTGKKSDHSAAITGEKKVRWRKASGTITLGTIIDSMADELDSLTWTWTLDTSSGNIRIRVTGVAATTVDWNATYYSSTIV